jgi:hypothetical protein
MGQTASAVYLAIPPDNDQSLKDNLELVLLRAGIGVKTFYQTPSELDTNHLDKLLSEVGCSVHIVGLHYGEPLPNSNHSFQEIQYLKAKEKAIKDPNFKLFIWHPTSNISPADSKQAMFLNEISNTISSNTIFSTVTSPIQLVEDIRNYTQKQEKPVFDLSDSDIFLVFNELDETEAEEITDMLSDIVPVDKMSIVQDSDMDYSEYCSQQFGKSKLAVVYFKYSSDWALPFTQEIWKKVGGAGAHTPILLIGDEDPESNLNKKLRAPKIISLIVAGELVPLEIKVQYDKIVEALS